jgi:predicted transporter
MRVIRAIVSVLALLLGAYCLIAATVLYAQTDSGHPNPAELAARERYQWPGWIPVVFLALVVLYAIIVAARRRGRTSGAPRPSPPSTQDPPLIEPAARRDRDSASR